MRSPGPRPLLLIVAALVLAAGCASPRAGGEARNTVRTILFHDPASLTFIGNPDYNSEIVSKLVCDSLVEYDEQMVLRPRVAASWDVTPDGRIVVFHLRPGVRWHDGRPVTASDVVFTVRKVQDPATLSTSLRPSFADVTSIEALDPLTVKVVYGHPYADFLEAWRVPLVPEHLLSAEKDFFGGGFALHPVGCGPFRFVRWEHGREIVLEANRDYWDGAPKIARFVLKIVSNERTGYQALLAGDLDFMVLTPDLWREAQSSSRASRFVRLVYTPMRVWYVGFNLDGSNPFFGDPKTRRAMTLALDRSRFANRVLGGLARPASGTFLPDSLDREHAIEPWPYDPREAARLLDEAGWRDADGDGVRERNGVPFSFTLTYAPASQEIVDRIAVWIQQSLADVGVRVQIEKVEWKAFQERRRAHRFQAAMATWTFTPLLDQFELFHSTSRETGMNYGGFSDPEVDRLLEEGRTTFDPGARARIYGRIRQRVHELEPVMFLFHMTTPALVDARLEGVRPSPLGVYQFSPGARAWRFRDSSLAGD